METVIEKVWTKSRILIKGVVVFILVLLLLIPTYSVTRLIEEREARQKEAITEVSAKWAGKQILTGPVLVLPFWHNTTDTTHKAVSIKHYAYFLPDLLNINSTVTPRQRSRGIYKVMLYQAQVNMNGTFASPALDQLKIAADKVLWNEAFIKMNVGDAKGLNEEVKLKWNDSLLTLNAQGTPDPGWEGMSAAIPSTGINDFKDIRFSTQLSLNGSEQLLFTPIGKTTTVQLNAPWPHPSFTGNTLPQNSRISDSSFTASWKSLAHKRSFPQYWTDLMPVVHNYAGQPVTMQDNMAEAAFGVDLFIPVNGYQKTLRTIKYAVLCILLTFAAFYLIDTANEKNVHPFQYGLIGLALVLFYLLLLSFSEYIGFNAAYLVAAAATIGLITWFVKDLLQSGRLSALLSVVLLLVYVYVFTILQLQDYALLLGSIGLFLSLAVIMHFSKKLRW